MPDRSLSYSVNIDSSVPRLVLSHVVRVRYHLFFLCACLAHLVNVNIGSSLPRLVPVN